MDEFEKMDGFEEMSSVENEEKIGNSDDAAVSDMTDFTGFNDDFFLEEDYEDEKKSGVPIVGIVAIIIALIFAVVCFLLVRNNMKDNNASLAANQEEVITAEVRDGDLYINDKKVDPEDVGIDPNDPEQLEAYVSDLNSGNVTVPNSVAQRYNIPSGGSSSGNVTPNNGNGSANTPAATPGNEATTKKGQTIYKPTSVLITFPVNNQQFEVGYKNKVQYSLGPVYTSNSERGVTITSSDPSVVKVDHNGHNLYFETLKIGTATLTVQSTSNPNAKRSVTVKVVDHTTTRVVVVPTVTTRPSTTTTTNPNTTLPTIPTTAPTPTTPPASTPSTGNVEIQNMSLQGASAIDGYLRRDLAVGGYTVININFTPSNATKNDVTFTSSDDSICTVSADGTVRAVGKGTATITVSAKKGSAPDCIAFITVK